MLEDPDREYNEWERNGDVFADHAEDDQTNDAEEEG